MCNQTFDFSPLATRPGFLRVCFHAICLAAVGFTGAAIDKSFWGKGDLYCLSSSCPRHWLVEWSLAIIILSWLFGLAMLVALISPIYNRTKIFCFGNTFGYPTFGFLLTGSFIFIIAYLIQVAVFNPCDFFKTPGCVSIRENKSLYFQPGFFAVGAVTALVAGILGIYITKDTRSHERNTLSTTQTSSIQTTSRQSFVVSV